LTDELTRKSVGGLENYGIREYYDLIKNEKDEYYNPAEAFTI